jgi:hypothetical protein
MMVVFVGAEVLANEHGLGKALLYLVSAGDRTIQTLLENQVNKMQCLIQFLDGIFGAKAPKNCRNC